MAELLLGPVLRHVDRTSATVWVETDAPCAVTVACDDGSATAVTWNVFGHYYALVLVEGLTPGRTRPYRVRLDERTCWPEERSVHPPSVIRTQAADGDDRDLNVVFGSCRWSSPPSTEAEEDRHLDPDALDMLAHRLTRTQDEPLPDALLLLGDQVYADETSRAMQNRLAGLRDLTKAPGPQIANFDEYTMLYHESWSDPQIRWLLSTVPSAMIFDDHDVIDDWNTSRAWRADMAQTDWWSERIAGALASYWVYQHVGNLAPDALATDPMLAAIREAGEGTDVGPLLHEFALRADAEADGKETTRWSFRRDFGRTRLLMIDSRAGRVLTDDGRAMISAGELTWVTEQADEGGYDHLLIGTSLPWLLPHGIHDLEAWNEALCAGARGPRWAALSEKVRRAGDLEHWAAFRESFEALSALLGRIALHGPRGGGPAPATVCVLSGDVHHVYAAEALWVDAAEGPHEGDSASGMDGAGGAGGAARVYQLTCSPVHNSVPPAIRLGFRFGWGRVATRIGRGLARHGRLVPLPITWTKLGGPWFGNHLMTLTLRNRRATLSLDRAEGGRRGRDSRLRRVGRAVLREG
ncbi:alkaline phosphatase D family protein [Streptomyces sp. SID3343]|uniref:alkaline phosphatase D family protein n=1 Tax=Streptomyces sp. SID3343 TaxID=2690260 RepID=UPI00136C3860|nr:alkaline phosphatase D family protein [Streptomyces sp. SID3343]MYV97133.1 alkaline phosphatase family protein [Streptomyces sp. SID3343]